MVIFLFALLPPQSITAMWKREKGWRRLKSSFPLSLVSNCEVADKSTCGADGFSFVLPWGTKFEETLCGFRRSNTRARYCVSSWRNAFDAGGEWHNTQNALQPLYRYLREFRERVAVCVSFRGVPLCFPPRGDRSNVTHCVNNSNLSNTFVKLLRSDTGLYAVNPYLKIDGFENMFKFISLIEKLLMKLGISTQKLAQT
jgi:hypothetical protein